MCKCYDCKYYPTKCWGDFRGCMFYKRSQLPIIMLAAIISLLLTAVLYVVCL